MSNIKRIIPSRLAKLRLDFNYSQADICSLLNEYLNGECKLNTSSISAWENGRRGVPHKYDDILASIFGVSKKYLLGLSDRDVNSDEEDSLEYDNLMMERNKIEIPFIHLYKYDKQPVYIVFNTYQHENAWGIYDDKRKCICFIDFELDLVSSIVKDIAFFALRPSFAPVVGLGKATTDIVSLLTKKHVFIKMNTADITIAVKYNGWYHHNENNSALINSIGLVLPYEGLNISYTAYSMEERSE